MAFFQPTRLLATAALTFAGSLAITGPAQAGMISPSGNTYVIQDGQQFYYSSEVNGDRFTGTIRGNYNAVGYFNGRFTDYSTYGEGCSGHFNKGKLQADGTLYIAFEVDRAAPNHRCDSIGEYFEITVIPFNGSDKAMLWASSPNEQIAIYGGSQSARAMSSYGVRGDRITLLDPIPSSNRIQVRFSSGVTGWVDSSHVIRDH